MKAKLFNFIALDLGSSKIACVAAYVGKQAQTKIVSQDLYHSKGIRGGKILDLKEAESSIIGAIYALEKDCGKNIKKITVSLTGAGTKSYYTNNKIKLSNQAISLSDIKKLIQKALAEFKLKDLEIIHYFPIEFTLDNNSSIDSPLGMFGKELSCELHIVAANSNILRNITNCFAKCHVEITNIVLAIYASGIACLTEDEKSQGVVIIDIGARTTCFGVFLAGKLIYTNYIDLGSFHITSDIAKVFAISFAAAEKLKVLHGNALLYSFDKNHTINMDDLDIDSPYNSLPLIKSSDLTEVINSRVEEIFQIVKKEYDNAIGNPLIARRLVITGGGSMLRGMKEVAAKIFEKQVRIGKPETIPGFAEGYNPSMYSTAIGIVKNQIIKQQKNSFKTEELEESGWLKKALNWLKENI